MERDQRVIALRTRERELRAAIVARARRASDMAREVSRLSTSLAEAMRVVAVEDPEVPPTGGGFSELRAVLGGLVDLGEQVERLQIELQETTRRKGELGG